MEVHMERVHGEDREEQKEAPILKLPKEVSPSFNIYIFCVCV